MLNQRVCKKLLVLTAFFFICVKAYADPFEGWREDGDGFFRGPRGEIGILRGIENPSSDIQIPQTPLIHSNSVPVQVTPELSRDDQIRAFVGMGGPVRPVITPITVVEGTVPVRVGPARTTQRNPRLQTLMDRREQDYRCLKQSREGASRRVRETISRFDSRVAKQLSVTLSFSGDKITSGLSEVFCGVDRLADTVDVIEDPNSSYSSTELRDQARESLRTSLNHLAQAARLESRDSSGFQEQMRLYEAARQRTVELLDQASRQPPRISEEPSPQRSLQEMQEIDPGIPSGHQCFPGETPICISANGFRPIESFQVGDSVLSCNLELGACECRQVQQVFRSTTTSLLRLTLSGGAVLRTTENHPFYVVSRRNWVEARDLNIGDTFQSFSGDSVSLESKERETGNFVVYNLDVQGNHNYYAEGILVHNCNGEGVLPVLGTVLSDTAPLRVIPGVGQVLMVGTVAVGGIAAIEQGIDYYNSHRSQESGLDTSNTQTLPQNLEDTSTVYGPTPLPDLGSTPLIPPTLPDTSTRLIPESLPNSSTFSPSEVVQLPTNTFTTGDGVRESQIEGFVPRDPVTGQPLPAERTRGGEIRPLSDQEHTVINVREGRRVGDYRQGFEFGRNGELRRRTDFTDHGRPENHSNPHDHRRVPNETGGTSRWEEH